VEHVELFERLGLALAIGLLMGLERGWQSRDAPSGHRPAGIRTFALIGLLGGVTGAASLHLGPMAMAAGFLSITALVVCSYMATSRGDETGRLRLGITTEVAELIAFALGALSATGEMAAAGAGAVVATALLDAKEFLHQWVRRLESLELKAAIRLLIISVVLLPLLPNQGYGPGEALNPYRLWLLVVMVAAISFLGYFAIKIAGPRIGALLTGVFGGLASSTALTVSFARMGKQALDMQPALAAGVAVANTTMYVRLWAIVMILNARVGERLAGTLGVMAVAGLLGSWALWRMRSAEPEKGSGASLSNPFELGMAIKFAVLLTAVIVASKVLQSTLGEAGVLGLAGVAGLADVDAIALSMAQMGGRDVAVGVAATAVTIAAFVNTGVKAALVGALCGGLMARRVLAVVMVMMAAGTAGLFVRW
jgi:uncharacterized membrane protein (DUF4010 family)